MPLTPNVAVGGTSPPPGGIVLGEVHIVQLFQEQKAFSSVLTEQTSEWVAST